MSLFREFLTSAWKNFNLIAGFLMIMIVIISAIFAPLIAPYDMDEAHRENRLEEPSVEFKLGTDDFGRDMLSRIIYGTRITLKVAAIGAVIQLGLGVTIGLLSGYFGGWVDKIFIFIADITWCIPGMISALAIITVMGKGLTNSIIAISLVSWAQYARTVRAKTLSIKNMAFIETGIAFGENSLAIMIKYILPNIVPSLIVMISTSLPRTIISTTTLSFLGVGSQPPSPDWGLALKNGVNFLNRAPWLSIFPGLALLFTAYGFNLLGEGLRDTLDVRLKSQ